MSNDFGSVSVVDATYLGAIIVPMPDRRGPFLLVAGCMKTVHAYEMRQQEASAA